MSVCEKPRINLPVLVEGKYDKIRLNTVFDCDVIVLNGFSFFRDAYQTPLRTGPASGPFRKIHQIRANCIKQYRRPRMFRPPATV